MISVSRTSEGAAAYAAFKAQGYAAYLESAWWQSLRVRLLVGPCLGCRSCPATTLHHVRYNRLGCETDGQLIALCHRCHKRLHKHLLAEYPDLPRGRSAKYTRAVWGDVFAAPAPKRQQRPKHRKTKAPARAWVGNRSVRKPLPKPKTRKAKPRYKPSGFKVSAVPLAPLVPLATLPTRRPCNALAGHIAPHLRTTRKQRAATP